MRKLNFAYILVVLVNLYSLAFAQGVASYAPAVDQAKNAVVSIYTAKNIQYQQHGQQGMLDRMLRKNHPQKRHVLSGLGSGVIVNSNGIILTNNHILRHADEVYIALADGRKVEAKIVGRDPESDVAVLKINLNKLQPIKLGNSENLRVGDVVLAIGNPFGLHETVTQGIVSALHRNSVGINRYENFIQTDAAINPGNSGGALINSHGQLVGINSAIFSKSGGNQGIGFAIPVNFAMDIAKQLIKEGRVRRGYLGVSIYNMSQALANRLNIKLIPGVIISEIAHDSPAMHYGLHIGDILNKINNQPITDGHDFLQEIAKIQPGTSVKFTVFRGNRSYVKTVKIGLRPQVRPITPQDEQPYSPY